MSFAVLETVVLVWFRDKLRLDGALTWPYLVMLGLGLAAAGRGVVDAAEAPGRSRRWPTETPRCRRACAGRCSPSSCSSASWACSDFVATGFGTSRKVFPEPLSAFTLRAFAAFYLSMAVGALTLLPSDCRPDGDLMRAGMGLIVPITLAAVVSIGRFDFSAHPGQAAYIAAYVVVGVAVVVVLPRLRRP